MTYHVMLHWLSGIQNTWYTFVGSDHKIELLTFGRPFYGVWELWLSEWARTICYFSISILLSILYMYACIVYMFVYTYR